MRGLPRDFLRRPRLRDLTTASGGPCTLADRLVRSCLAASATLLRLLLEELRQVHGLRKDDVVLVELNAARAARLVRLLPLHLEAQFFGGENHFSGILAEPHLVAYLFAFEVSRLVYGQVRTVVGVLLVLVGLVEVSGALGSQAVAGVGGGREVGTLLDGAEELVQIHFLVSRVV